MIEHFSADIWGSKAMAIVVPVNTVGVPGKGLALEMAKRFPACAKEYKEACLGLLGFPGRVVWISPKGQRPVILAFSTKKHWRDPSKIEWIESGMESLVDHLAFTRITSCAIPALGCGNGGLDWKDVLPIIEKHCAMAREIRWLIYEPKK